MLHSRLANEGQTKLKGEVQDLSAQLQAVLDQNPEFVCGSSDYTVSPGCRCKAKREAA